VAGEVVSIVVVSLSQQDLETATYLRITLFFDFRSSVIPVIPYNLHFEFSFGIEVAFS